MSTKNTTEIVDTASQRISGLQKHVSKKAQITIRRKSMKLEQVIGIYQGLIDARTTLKSKRAETKVAQQSYLTANAAQSALDKGLRAWVETNYGLDSQEARDMGFAPAKVGKKSVAVKNDAVLQSQATREARHTLGKKQKAQIKGTVVAPTAPAEPATHEAPAAQAAGTPQPATVTTPTNGAAATATNGAAAH
jgi:hypothetical protein